MKIKRVLRWVFGIVVTGVAIAVIATWITNAFPRPAKLGEAIAGAQRAGWSNLFDYLSGQRVVPTWVFVGLLLLFLAGFPLAVWIGIKVGELRARGVTGGLSQLELSILRLFVGTGGGPWESGAITERLGVSGLLASKAVEDLLARRLVDVVQRREFGDAVVHLTHQGRDFLIKNGDVPDPTRLIAG